MNEDPYRRIAGVYDRLFEGMNQGLRVLGFRMFIPPRGGAILDVGCGTGAHLEMYQRYGCKLFGMDASESMIGLARTRLGDRAQLRRGDATHMEYEGKSFDLVICMLALHEMDQQTRTAVISEIKRVVKSDGRVLFIDFHADRPRPVKGWYSKLVIFLSEVGAGRRHFRNYRSFMALGGLPRVIADNQLTVEKVKVVGEDTMALYLLSVN